MKRTVIACKVCGTALYVASKVVSHPKVPLAKDYRDARTGDPQKKGLAVRNWCHPRQPWVYEDRDDQAPLVLFA